MATNPETAPPHAEPAGMLPSFEEIFSAHVRYLWYTLRRLGIQEGDLEDVAHEILLRVHAQLAHLDPGKPIRPWIFGLALGTAANYRRLARHRTDLNANPPEPHDPNHGAEELLIARERRIQVQQALERVPLHHRAVLILHDMDETSVPDIASVLALARIPPTRASGLGARGFGGGRATYRQSLACGYRSARGGGNSGSDSLGLGGRCGWGSNADAAAVPRRWPRDISPARMGRKSRRICAAEAAPLIFR